VTPNALGCEECLKIGFNLYLISGCLLAPETQG
jgi:hypothetical protein